MIYRQAKLEDLPALIQMLADDALGQSREDANMPPNKAYVAAFEAIQADANQQLIVVEKDKQIVGTFQLSFIPGLARLGAWRGQIEAVRIAKPYRGTGLGTEMFKWAIEQCTEKGCYLVQLTTDKARPEAHKFYEKLGFIASHEGYKLAL